MQAVSEAEGELGVRSAAAFAARVTARETENFTVLAPFVPRELRGDMGAVYAFCRGADDIADAGADEASRAAAIAELARWREQLARCGSPVRAPGVELSPVFIALGETIRKHRMPTVFFEKLLSAFEEDQRVTRYSTWSELVDYSKRSANPVGRICLWLAGHRWDVESDAMEPRLSMSDSVCTGLQLANFWQDVRRDLLDLDRVYMPFKETGLSAEELRAWAGQPATDDRRERFAEAVKPLVERTRTLFRAGSMLPSMTAPWLARCVRLFASGGVTVLDRVEDGGYSTLWKRPRVGKFAKMMLVAKELMRI